MFYYITYYYVESPYILKIISFLLDYFNSFKYIPET